MDDKIISMNDFTKGTKDVDVPFEANIKVVVRTVDNLIETLNVKGFLVYAPDFVAVAKGPMGKTEFMFVSPVENVIYAAVVDAG